MNDFCARDETYSPYTKEEIEAIVNSLEYAGNWEEVIDDLDLDMDEENALLTNLKYNLQPQSGNRFLLVIESYSLLFWSFFFNKLHYFFFKCFCYLVNYV